MEATKGNGAPADARVDCSAWDKRLTEMFEEASKSDEERTAFIGAYIAHMPQVLEQLQAHDLALGVKMRFFRETKQTQVRLPQLPKIQKAPEPAPAPETNTPPPS